MDDFEINLDLLNEALIRKIDILEQVLCITENQQTVLENPEYGQTDDFFKQMNTEKQILIDEVLSIDEVFQGIFNKISGDFESRAQRYGSEISGLQAAIRQVCDLDIKIRLQEDKNSRVREVKKHIGTASKPSRKHIIGEYAKNNRFTN